MSMSRRSTTAALAALAVCVLALTACTRMVKVETGERLVDANGRIISSNVRVIEVPSDKAGMYSVVTKTVPSATAGLDALYAAAQAALASGDTTAAQRELQQVVKGDQKYRRAASQLAELNAGKKPAPDTTGAPSSSGDRKPVGPVAGLSSWVPGTLFGFKGAPIAADVYTLTREYTPTSKSAADGLVIVVEQYKNAASAQAAAAGTISRDYPASPSTFASKGRTIHFGTDGRRFAVGAWNESGVLIVVEVSSGSRSPKSLVSTLRSLTGALIK